MSDFFADPANLPAVNGGQVPATQDDQEGAVQVRTANANLGATRVAVARHMPTVMKRIDEMAQVVGHRWKYALPFAGQRVEGATVGCALDIARLYGNCNVEVDRIEETGDSWLFYASFLDIETGFRVVRPFRQRKQMKTGEFKGDLERKMDNIFLIGASKAMRNVVVNALRGLVDEALSKAEHRFTDRVAQNKEGALKAIREKMVELDLDEARVTKYFGEKMDKLQPPKIAMIWKMIMAIEDGVTPADQFLADAEKPAAQAVEPMSDEPVGAGETEPGTASGVVEEKQRAATEKVKVTWRGKVYTKTKLITDVKRAIKEATTDIELEELYDELVAAKKTAEGDAPRMWQDLSDMINTAQDLMAAQNADPDTGEVADDEPPAHVTDVEDDDMEEMNLA